MPKGVAYENFVKYGHDHKFADTTTVLGKYWQVVTHTMSRYPYELRDGSDRWRCNDVVHEGVEKCCPEVRNTD